MPRQARLGAPGTLHHVMLRGIEKRGIVSNAEHREDFVARLGADGRDTGTAIYAWALLPNRDYIAQGVALGRRAELVGGGLIRGGRRPPPPRDHLGDLPAVPAGERREGEVNLVKDDPYHAA